MATVKYEIPLLDRTTRFSLWQVKMRAVLAQMDLDDALLGFKKMPSSWSEAEKERKDRKALSQIHLHLSNEILQDVVKEKTAAALWLKLEQICMTKSLTSKLHLKQRLYSHRLTEGMSLEDYLTKFKELVSDLESLEVKYDDEDLGLILLCSLPSSYDTFRDTIMYSRDTLSLSEVYEALYSKARMKLLVTGSESQGEGLFVRGRTQEKNFGIENRGRSKSKYKNKFCNYCKKKGHTKSECYSLQNKNKRGEKQKEKKPNTGEASVIEEASDGELLVISDVESL
jgi:hypothetical protein